MIGAPRLPDPPGSILDGILWLKNENLRNEPTNPNKIKRWIPKANPSGRQSNYKRRHSEPSRNAVEPILPARSPKSSLP